MRTTMVRDHFIYSLVTLTALMAPLVELPIFMGVVGDRPPRELRRAALKVAAGSFLILAVSASFGTTLLDLFGVSLPAFRTAGGLVLIVIGMQMLQGRSPDMTSDPREEADPEDRLWMPIIMPLIAGPAAITTAVTLSIREQAIHALIPWSTLLAILAASLVVYVLLMLARPLSRAISPRSARISERFLGLILTAVGFQMGLTGAYEFLMGTPYEPAPRG